MGSPKDARLRCAKESEGQIMDMIQFDRNQWAGCEYCTAGQNMESIENSDFSAHEFRIDGDSILYNDSHYGWEGVKIKFCPFCGRPLTKEVWKATEKKMDAADQARLAKLTEADRAGRVVILPDISCTDANGEEALRQAMWQCGYTNNGVTRFTADAIAEKLCRDAGTHGMGMADDGDDIICTGDCKICPIHDICEFAEALEKNRQ